MFRMQFILRSTICYQNVYALQKQRSLLTAILPITTPTTKSNAAVQQRTLATGAGSGGATGVNAANRQKKTKEISKITLIGQNQAISITTLEDAQKLAKRRELHLLQMEQLDTKTGRALYKLVTASEMLAHEHDDAKISNKSSTESSGDKDKAAQKKSEKSLTIGMRITEHDLASRIKNINKWLTKRHEVRILIQGPANDTNCERIFNLIEQSIREPQIIGKIVQKRTKGTVTKFNILPVNTTVAATVTSESS